MSQITSNETFVSDNPNVEMELQFHDQTGYHFIKNSTVSSNVLRLDPYVDKNFNPVFFKNYCFRPFSTTRTILYHPERVKIDIIKRVIDSGDAGSYFYYSTPDLAIRRCFITPKFQLYTSNQVGVFREKYNEKEKRWELSHDDTFSDKIKEQIMAECFQMFDNLLPEFEIPLSLDQLFLTPGEDTLQKLFYWFHNALEKAVEFIGVVPNYLKKSSTHNIISYANTNYGLNITLPSHCESILEPRKNRRHYDEALSFLTCFEDYVNEVYDSEDMLTMSDKRLASMRENLDYLKTTFTVLHFHLRAEVIEARVSKRPAKKQKTVTATRKRKQLVLVYQNSMDAETKKPCAICHENYVEGVKIARQVCGHVFHADCIVQYDKLICPTCRQPCD